MFANILRMGWLKKVPMKDLSHRSSHHHTLVEYSRCMLSCQQLCTQGGQKDSGAPITHFFTVRLESVNITCLSRRQYPPAYDACVFFF